MMAKRNAVAKGGIFGASDQRPLSQGTQNLLKVMMEESKLTNFQRRKLTASVKDRQALPVNVPSGHTFNELPQQHIMLPQTIFTMRGQPQSAMRTRDMIEDSGAYVRDKYISQPTKSLEKEKQRLSNIMAYGEDVKPPSKAEMLEKIRQKNSRNAPKKDRFDEIQEEIQERKEFMESMEKTGRGKEYRPIINAQISQLIREMEVIDKQRTAQLNYILDQEDVESDS